MKFGEREFYTFAIGGVKKPPETISIPFFNADDHSELIERAKKWAKIDLLKSACLEVIERFETSGVTEECDEIKAKTKID